MKMLPLYDVKYLMINRSESLLSGNIESRKVRHAIKKGYEWDTHISCALSLQSQIIITGLGIDARRVHDDKEEEKDASS
jgi:hypothetical protein